MKAIKADKDSVLLTVRLAVTILKTFTTGKTKTGLYLTAAALAAGKYFFGIEIPSTDLSGAPLPVEAAGIAGSILISIGIIHDLFKKSKSAINIIRDEIKE